MCLYLLFLLLAVPLCGESCIAFDFSESEKKLNWEQTGETCFLEGTTRMIEEETCLYGAAFSINQFYAGNLRLPMAMTQLDSGYSLTGRRKNTIGVSSKADNGEEWGIGWFSDEGYGILGEKTENEYQVGGWFNQGDELPEIALVASRFAPGKSLAQSKRSVPVTSLIHGAGFQSFSFSDVVFDCQASFSCGVFLQPGALLSSLLAGKINASWKYKLLTTAATPSYRQLNRGIRESIPLEIRGQLFRGSFSILGGLETPLPACQDGSSFQFPVECRYRWEKKPYYIKLTGKGVFEMSGFETSGQIDAGVKRGRNSDCLTLLGYYQSDTGFTRLKAGLKEKIEPFEWELSLDSDPQDYFVSDLFFSWGFRLPRFSFFMEWKRPLISFPEEAGPIDFSVNGKISF